MMSEHPAAAPGQQKGHLWELISAEGSLTSFAEVCLWNIILIKPMTVSLHPLELMKKRGAYAPA
jgi:hypothetical protein